MRLPFTALRASWQRNRDAGLSELAHKAWRFALGTLRGQLAFRQVTKLGFGVRILGHAPVIDNEGGTIELGDHLLFEAPVTPAYLDVERGALLRIGEDTYLNDGVWIGVTEQVIIGARVRIGPGVRIMDSAYHQLQNRGVRPPSRPVVIEDDVWISSDSMISPGVRVGKGAVVGAHSLVLKDVAPFTVVGGVPAKQLKEVDRVSFERAKG